MTCDPGLDIRPVRNYFGGGGTYDVVWYHNYPEVHIAVLEEDHQIKHKVRLGLLNATLKPDKKSTLFQNLKKFKEMFSFECSDDYWRTLMRDVVRHNVDKNVKCGDNFGIACDTGSAIRYKVYLTKDTKVICQKNGR